MSLMYLEDYLELVSFLPQEFCDRLTKVRELDLEASNRRDNVERIKERISKDSPGKTRPTASGDAAASSAERAALMKEMATEYDLIVQLNLEKVRIVSGLEDLMLKYNRRLTTDTEKFKMELEADNPGITESLEARAELDMRNLRDNIPSKQTPPEVRVPSSRRIADMGLIVAMQKQKQQGGVSSNNKNALTTPDHSSQKRPNNNSSVNIQQGAGHGNNMLASLKASYEASVRVTPNNLSRDQSVDRNEAVSSAAVTSAFAQSERRKRQSHKKMDAYEDDDEAVDEDSKLYCICKQASFGFMIACDNPRCPVEWFHGSCVGVTQSSSDAATDKWFCPGCRAEQSRERERRLKNPRGDGGMFQLDKHYKLDQNQASSKMPLPGKKYRRPQ
ncbi:hypothetical protein BV898_07534 [Hypsibius exemplaris]|uniref:Inhibitor of growth protein n=1 Tax=Hypsibius exemplaris TaxID=2072580 RepID=A0A1W0WT12_HYPEX|nr:hypothetical protein BV898_07534 [Hypsibius exemplaris]